MKYIVQGNYSRFSVTLTQNDGTEVTPYVPIDSDIVRISLNGARRYEYTEFEQNGNVLTFEDNGCLKVGSYQLEVKIVDSNSHNLRCMYREQVRVVASNDDVPTDASFDVGDIELNAELSVTATVVVDDALSSTSENPVQNKVITYVLPVSSGRNNLQMWVKNSSGKQLFTLPYATNTLAGVMTSAQKVKLDNIEEGANKTIVDDALSDSSTNPVQNKVLKPVIDSAIYNTFLFEASEEDGGGVEFIFTDRNDRRISGGGDRDNIPLANTNLDPKNGWTCGLMANADKVALDDIKDVIAYYKRINSYESPTMVSIMDCEEDGSWAGEYFDVAIPSATHTKAGVMSAADKTKLDQLAEDIAAIKQQLGL